MYSRLQGMFIASSLLLLLALFELIRRRKLEERYALLWIITGGAFLVVSLRTSILDRIAGFLGVIVPANALFLFGLVFMIVLVLSLTIVLSALARKNDRLSQRLSLLQFEVEELKTKSGRGGEGERGR